MPPKKTTKKPSLQSAVKNKDKPSFFMFVAYSILISFFAYLVSVSIASGVALFFNPYISYMNDNKGKNYSYIEYATDKAEYVLGENVKLFLVNNLKESIFLAPCRYFKHFESRKISAGEGGSKKIEWQPVNLALDPDCKNYIVDSEKNSFNRIRKIADQYVSTKDFGVGIFRGVSNIYLQCAKPDEESCKGSITVYSNEFKINSGVAETKK